MDQTSPLTPELHADLVAYLDGELDEAATLEVERALAESPVIRRKIEALTRTFEMLEELPRERVSEEFTERTLATIQVENDTSERPPEPWFKRLPRGLIIAGWVATMAAGVVLGVVLSDRAGDDEADRLVEELPLVKNLGVYTDLESIDYLRELHNSGLFDDDPQSLQP